MRWSSKSLLGFALLGLAAGSTPAVQQGGDEDAQVVVEARDGGIEVEKLLTLAADVTGEPFFYEPAALHGLRARPIGKASIPLRRLMAYLDDQLREHDLLVLEAVVAGVRCHSVVSLRSTSSRNVKPRAEYVPVEGLAAIADRTKLVTSTFTFRSLGLAAGMDHTVCYRFADSATESIRRIQGTGSYVLTGAASNVAQVVAFMRELDAKGLRSELDEKEANDFASLNRRITALEQALAGR